MGARKQQKLFEDVDLKTSCELKEAQSGLLNLLWPMDQSRIQLLWPYLHDRMVESIVTETGQIELIFSRSEPRQLQEITILSSGIEALENANETIRVSAFKIGVELHLQVVQIEMS